MEEEGRPIWTREESGVGRRLAKVKAQFGMVWKQTMRFASHILFLAELESGSALWSLRSSCWIVCGDGAGAKLFKAPAQADTRLRT